MQHAGGSLRQKRQKKKLMRSEQNSINYAFKQAMTSFDNGAKTQ